MKVGDYVRLPDGIHKIKHYEYKPDYENCHCMYLDDNDYGLLFTNKDLIKSSPNIIDLIEKKDIIKYHFNGYDYISEVFDYKNDLWVQNENNMFEISEINIKSIVTKEQFSSMEYKIGG